MNNNSNQYLLPIVASITMIIGILMGLTLSPSSSVTPTSSVHAKKLLDIFDILEREYVDEVDKESLMEETISNMLHQLDPHSNYIPAAELARMKESIEGTFDGIGIRFAILRDTLHVTNVVNYSPSEMAGLKVYDQIIMVDDDTIAGVQLNNRRVQELLKGPRGTKVQLTIKRGGEIKKITIQRGPIPLPSISAAFMIDERTGYIRLDQFSMQSGKEFLEAAIKLKNKGMQRLIFDLRYNSGGVMGAAIDIADAFLEPGLPIVSTKSKNRGEEIEYSRNTPILGKVELVVMINQASASASEIVAGAIQDNDRGTIVGRRSFGKGLVQQDINLKDGSNLRLTTSRYYTPTGRSIQRPYSGDYEAYLMDEITRYESGELYEVDSSLFVDSLKFITPGGKVVFGGGGIMPDVFIPIDTTNITHYFRHLQYASAFSNFAYEYARNGKITRPASLEEFGQRFKVTDAILQDFREYASEHHVFKASETDWQRSKERIRQEIHAEIARHFFLENGLLLIRSRFDHEVLRALQEFTQ
jgi:carboxyl-terminal processing protease